MTTFLFEHGSYLVITLVLVATGFGLPVPEEVPVVVAGVMASHGQLEPWLAFAFCLLGALGGDCVIYAIGHHFGRSVIRKHPYWARAVGPQREAKIERLIHHHGLKVLFVARFLVVLRSPVFLTAGILRMPFRRFLLIDLFCATIVVGTFFLLSFYFGQTITHWIRRVEIVITVVVVLAAAVAAVYLWRRYHREAVAAEPTAAKMTPSACGDGHDRRKAVLRKAE